MCKKYSQGPCGEIFNDWLSCIDSNMGSEQNCDEYAKRLKECLDRHNQYYDTIDSYGETQDAKDDENIQKWRLFVDELEQDGKMITFEDGTHPPEMQIRLKSKMGAAMFHPNISTTGDILLLVYVKDQHGELLGAGSVDELFYWNEFNNEDKNHHTSLLKEDDENGKLILRFRVDDKTTHVNLYALYGPEHEHCEGNPKDDTPVIRWRKLELKR